MADLLGSGWVQLPGGSWVPPDFPVPEPPPIPLPTLPYTPPPPAPSIWTRPIGGALADSMLANLGAAVIAVEISEWWNGMNDCDDKGKIVALQARVSAGRAAALTPGLTKQQQDQINDNVNAALLKLNDKYQDLQDHLDKNVLIRIGEGAKGIWKWIVE